MHKRLRHYSHSCSDKLFVGPIKASLDRITLKFLTKVIELWYQWVRRVWCSCVFWRRGAFLPPVLRWWILIGRRRRRRRWARLPRPHSLVQLPRNRSVCPPCECAPSKTPAALSWSPFDYALRGTQTASPKTSKLGRGILSDDYSKTTGSILFLGHIVESVGWRRQTWREIQNFDFAPSDCLIFVLFFFHNFL